MNCLEFRRLLLAQPRQITSEQRAHMERCASCAEFARRVADDEEALEQAVLVPVPEGLAARVLLRHRLRSPNRWSTLALAASLVIAAGAGFYFYAIPPQPDEIVNAQRLGANHPAVAAISYVLDHEPQLLKENRTGDPEVMRAALAKLGLSLPGNIGSVRYLGKCPVEGGTGEHVVLETPFGHATLILVPDRLFASRVVVSDRNLRALSAPSRSGSYILIADSAQTLKRVEAMLI